MELHETHIWGSHFISTEQCWSRTCLRCTFQGYWSALVHPWLRAAPEKNNFLILCIYFHEQRKTSAESHKDFPACAVKWQWLNKGIQIGNLKLLLPSYFHFLHSCSWHIDSPPLLMPSDPLPWGDQENFKDQTCSGWVRVDRSCDHCSNELLRRKELVLFLHKSNERLEGWEKFNLARRRTIFSQTLHNEIGCLRI